MNTHRRRRQNEAGYYKYNLYKPEKPATWWLRNGKYFLFMMREFSSAVIALFLLLYLYEFFLLSKGETIFNTFQGSLRRPAFLVFYGVVFLFALYHSVTWLAVVGRVQVVRLGNLTVPPSLVTAGAFAGWAVVSVALAIYLMR